MSQSVIPSDHLELDERAHRARAIARALRHDLDNNPPADARVSKEAELRYRRYGDEAAAFEVELKRVRGY